MQKTIVVEMLAQIKTLFPYAFKDTTAQTANILVNAWTDALSEYPDELVKSAFKQAVKGCKMPPTIADVIEQIEKIQSIAEKSNAELWDEYKSILFAAADLSDKFSYSFIPDGEKRTQGEIARDELNKLWEKLAPSIQEYCGSVNNLIYTARNDDLTFEKTRFFKNIKNCQNRIKMKNSVSKIALSTKEPNKLLGETK